MKIGLVVFWFGPWPSWSKQWAARFEASSHIYDLIVVCDHTPCPLSASRVIRCTATDFPKFVEERTGIHCRKHGAWAFCDFRPGFGEVFESELAEYEWWGWGDLDTVWGDWGRYLANPILEQYDVLTAISPEMKHLNGPWTILRNKPEITRLYRKFAEWLWRNKHNTSFNERGFNILIRDAGIKTRYDDQIETHDRVLVDQGKTVRLTGDRLYCDDNEIFLYHFNKRKKEGWPLDESTGKLRAVVEG